MADFDVKAAREAGYSDAEIADHLAGMRKFDAAAARQSGYSDAEIVDHLAPGPSLPRQALDATLDFADRAAGYARTLGNDMLGGVIGMPRLAMEGIDWLGKKDAEHGGTGARMPREMIEALPTPQEATRSLNLPQPPVTFGLPIRQEAMDEWRQTKDTPRPRLSSGNQVVDVAAAGAMSLPFTGGASWPALGASIGGPAVSELAGQAAEGTPYETPVRLLGALVGAGGGAAVPSLVRKAGNVVTGLRAPFTKAGQDKIVGAALRDAASDPDAAVTNLQKYQIGREAFPDTVPGFKIDAGKASRDPGLMAAADVVPDRIRGLNVQNNNIALTGALDDAARGLPPPGDAPGTIQKALADRFKTLQEARSSAATPLYEAARNFPDDLPIGKLFKYTDDVIAANKGEPKAVMTAARKLLFDAQGRPDFSARGLMAAREGLGGLFTPTLDKHSRSLLKGLQTRIDETLQSIPEAAAGRAKFAEMSVPLEPFGKKTLASKIVETDPITKKFVLPEGKVLGDLKAQDVQNILMASGGNPNVKTSLASAYLDDFKASVGNIAQKDPTGRPMLGAYPAAKWMDKHRGAARNVLSDDQVRALDDITKHLGDQAQAVPGRSGSPTFDRLASESILKAVIGRKEVPAWLHPVQKALTLNGIIDIYGGANKQMLDRMIEVIGDPAVTAALMKKATPGNVKMMEPMLQSIGRGTALGATSAAEAVR